MDKESLIVVIINLHVQKTSGRSGKAMSSISQSILMALTVTVNKFASSNVQAVHRRQRKDRRKTTSSKAANDFGRRGLLLSAAFATPLSVNLG
ncbi:hypothetical protein Prudu_022284 [Prunus dulcis]|uniref:Uncharacterized protein n=1 Tax=Prunus dulcis TaxID=3755 RepID=A0A4Y1RZC6_PRUDU|nr:hypothetical protein Prudu_022284 [Prunus dulcis]